MEDQCHIEPIKCSEDFFLSLLYRSTHSDNEKLRILRTLNRYVKQSRNIFGAIEYINADTVRWKPLNDLADDCLISVALFEKHIQVMFQRKAAPSANWYIHIGTDSFKKLGYSDIANSYFYWIDFIRENIVI